MDARAHTLPVSVGTLRPFQEVGRDFLAARKSALLGDVMGLGKTAQAAAAAAAVLSREPAGSWILWVAPASTIPGLALEIQRWGLPAPVVCRPRSTAADVAGSKVILLSFDAAAKSLPVLLGRPRLSVLVIDEAHRCKSRWAQRTQAILGVWKRRGSGWERTQCLAAHAARVWALTGTPVPNRPIEIQPLLHLGFGLRWASVQAFGDAYCRRENRFAPRGYDYQGAHHLADLHARLVRDGVLLRRTAEDVAAELPPIQRILVPLGGVGDAAELSHEAVQEHLAQRGTLPFEELSRYRSVMGERKVPAVVAWCLDWLDASEDEALVLFAWHRDVAEAIGAAVAAELGAEAVLVTHGEEPPEARQAKVDRFAAGAARLFVGTIGATGTGLNGLHRRAGACVFAEFAWTPGELLQAEGRVRRMGGTASWCRAYYLAAQDSLESHVLLTLHEKMTIQDQILGDSAREAAREAGLPVSVPAAPRPSAPELPADLPDPATQRWGWRLERGTGQWLLVCEAEAASPFGAAQPHPWIGRVVTVCNRAGNALAAQLVARKYGGADGRGWSLWAWQPAPGDKHTRDRKYLSQRALYRGLKAAPRPLTAEEAVEAEAAHRAAAALTAMDPDYAEVLNGCGWSRADGLIGRILSELPVPAWDLSTLTLARSLLPKYHRQVGRLYSYSEGR